MRINTGRNISIDRLADQRRWLITAETDWQTEKDKESWDYQSDKTHAEVVEGDVEAMIEHLIDRIRHHFAGADPNRTYTLSAKIALNRDPRTPVVP